MKTIKIILVLLVWLIPCILNANLAISFLPDPDEMLRFPLFNPWLLFLIIFLKFLIYKIYIDKSIFKLALINCIAIAPLIIFGFFLAYFSAFLFDDKTSYIFLFLRDLFDKLSNIKGKYNFYANLITAMFFWIIPILIAFTSSFVIEKWILTKSFVAEDNKKISSLAINSNVLSFTIIYLSIIIYYYNLYHNYSPGYYK